MINIAQVPQSNGSLATLMAPGPTQPAPGVVNVSGGKIYDIYTVPPVLNFTTASNNGGGAGTVTQYIFNTSVLNPAVTTNGSGAGSITNTYGDGFSGRVYDSLLSNANGGSGVFIKGFTIQSTTTSTGAQISTPFNTLQMNIQNANGQGGSTPVPVDVTAAIRNNQFQVGILTVVFPFTLNGLNQISLSLPANTTFSFTFTTENGSL